MNTVPLLDRGDEHAGPKMHCEYCGGEIDRTGQAAEPHCNISTAWAIKRMMVRAKDDPASVLILMHRTMWPEGTLESIASYLSVHMRRTYTRAAVQQRCKSLATEYPMLANTLYPRRERSTKETPCPQP